MDFIAAHYGYSIPSIAIHQSQLELVHFVVLELGGEVGIQPTYLPEQHGSVSIPT